MMTIPINISIAVLCAFMSFEGFKLGQPAMAMINAALAGTNIGCAIHAIRKFGTKNK